MSKASILLRVSTIDQEEEEYKNPSKNFVIENNWDLFKIYREKGSAYKNSFEERKVFQKLIREAKENNVTHLVVYNMDRFSRLPAEQVLKYTEYLGKEYNLEVHAVDGDNWSELVNTVSKMKTLGFIGEAMAQMLETLLKGLEHKRAYEESRAKSEKVKLRVKKDKFGITTSSYGNKWGKKRKSNNNYKKILEYKKANPKLSMNKISQNLGLKSRGIVKYCLDNYILINNRAHKKEEKE